MMRLKVKSKFKAIEKSEAALETRGETIGMLKKALEEQKRRRGDEHMMGVSLSEELRIMTKFCEALKATKNQVKEALNRHEAEPLSGQEVQNELNGILKCLTMGDEAADFDELNKRLGGLKLH